MPLDLPGGFGQDVEIWGGAFVGLLMRLAGWVSGWLCVEGIHVGGGFKRELKENNNCLGYPYFETIPGDFYIGHSGGGI